MSKIDDLDLNIITAMINANTPLTSSALVKLIYNPRNRDISIRHNNRVIYRLKRLCRMGYATADATDQGYMNYSLCVAKIHHGMSKLTIGKEIINTGEAVAIEIENGSFMIVFNT